MYIVELVQGDNVVGLGIIESGNVYSWTSPSAAGYQYCSKFHNKDRAASACKKFESAYYKSKKISFKDHVSNAVTARVVSEYGTPTVQGSKQGVPEKKKDKVRR
jgi:hypothetical protein